MAKLSDLQAISDYVSWRFTYTTDIQSRGMLEHWVDLDELEELDSTNRGEFKDDCDGYALAVRYQCRKVGIPNRLVFCRTETGGGHLVVSVDGYIIDNRNKWVMDREDVDYTWLKISGLEKGDPWHTIGKDE